MPEPVDYEQATLDAIRRGHEQIDGELVPTAFAEALAYGLLRLAEATDRAAGKAGRP